MINFFSLWDVVSHPIHAAFRNSSELERMRRSGGAAELIAGVIADVVNDGPGHDTRAWRDRIEQLRDEMNASRELVTVADYGARSPLRRLSADEMYAGRTVHRTVGEICRSSSKPRKWSMFLHYLIRALKPHQCLELGTCLGISGAYIGAAMAMNGTGTLLTLEGADSLAERALNNFSMLGLTNITCVTGRFQDTLGPAIGQARAFEAVFIDGHHDGAATRSYFETILPALAPGAVVVFDDIGWSMEMQQAWRALRGHPMVDVSVDMFDMGICCIGASSKEQFTIAV